MGTGTDLRLVPAAAVAWVGAAWAVARPAAVVAWAAAACVLAALAVVVLFLVVRRGSRGCSGVGRRGPGRRYGQVCLALLAAGLVLTSTAGHLVVREAGVLPTLVERGATVDAEAVVRGDPQRVRPAPAGAEGAGPVWAAEEPRFVVRLALERVTGRGLSGQARARVLVIGDDRWAGVRPGQSVRVRGRLAAADPGDDVVALLLPTAGPEVTAEPGPVGRRAEVLRAGLRGATDELAPDSRGLLPGLVVGDTSRLPPDLEEAMRTVGLTHLTAVSGSNVAIVCGAVLLLAAWCGAGRRTRLGAAALALAGFVVLARPDPSVLRAAVMGGIGLVGLATARRGRGVPALGAAVVVLTTLDPWLGRAFGFALSVLATAALLLVAPAWATALGRVLPRPLALAVAVPAAAQAVCGPVVVLLSPQLALAAVPANLLVAPAVAPATVLGVAVTVLAPVWPWGAEQLARVAGLSTWWISVVARTAADVPWAAVPWPAGPSGAVLMAAATVVVAPVGLRVLTAGGRGGAGARGAVCPRGGAVAGERRRPGVSWCVAAVVAGVVLALLVVPGSPLGLRPASSWPPARWQVVACDVGQGDAMVLTTGPGSAVVVDVGPEPASVDGCLRRLDVEVVDLLVLSHFHADHVRGLEGVLRGRRVTRALVSPLNEPATQAASALELLQAHAVEVAVGTAGQAGRAGTLAWQVLWPAPTEVGPPLPGSAAGLDGEESSANDSSLVLAVDQPGLRTLTTGDVEPAAQAPLRRSLLQGHVPLPFDVLKVAHHGSAHQDDDLHRLVSPRVALISSGEDNDYGHPAPPTLGLLTEVGAVVARTDQLGDVAVGGDGQVSGPGGLWVAGRRARPDVARQGEAAAPCADAGARLWSCRPGVARSGRGSSAGEEPHLAGRRPGTAGAGDRDRVAARRPRRGAGAPRDARPPP